MSRESLTRELLGEGAVAIACVKPGRVVAVVHPRGTENRHEVTYADDRWSCTCPAAGWRCAHVQAVWRCTDTDVRRPPVPPTPSTTHPKENDPMSEITRPPEQAEARRLLAALITARNTKDWDGWAALGKIDDDVAARALLLEALHLSADFVLMVCEPLGTAEQFLASLRGDPA